MNDLTRHIEDFVGHCLPIDALTERVRPFVRLLSGPEVDHSGFPVWQRINGIAECPTCGLHWPLTEEIEEWIETDDGDVITSGWGMGGAICTDCGVVMVDTFEGTEAYQLPMEKKRE